MEYQRRSGPTLRYQRRLSCLYCTRHVSIQDPANYRDRWSGNNRIRRARSHQCGAAARLGYRHQAHCEPPRLGICCADVHRTRFSELQQNTMARNGCRGSSYYSWSLLVQSIQYGSLRGGRRRESLSGQSAFSNRCCRQGHAGFTPTRLCLLGSLWRLATVHAGECQSEYSL